MLNYIYICIILSAIFVISTVNPVHALFYLVLVFFFSAVYIYMLNNEFLAFMIIIIYIGAILVLFLFFIMMVNLKFFDLRVNYLIYIPMSFFLLFLLSSELSIIVLQNEIFLFQLSWDIYNIYIDYIMKYTNIHLIGLYLYTIYWLEIILCSILLYLAMIGIILLIMVSKFEF